MKSYLLFSSIIILFLTSCDPLQTIEFENKSDHLTTAKFFFQGKIASKFYGFQNNDSLTIVLEPEEKKVFNFGIGSWEINNTFDTLVSKIKKIEIINEYSTKSYSNKYQITNFLEKHILDNRYRARIIITFE